MRQSSEFFPILLTAIVTISTIIYTFYSILLWRTTRAAAEISRQAALSNLWAELNRYIEVFRSQNAAGKEFLEELSSLILEYMISNLLSRSSTANDKNFGRFRSKIVTLIESNRTDAAKFPWVTRITDPDL
jgi:hypothetical protein